MAEDILEHEILPLDSGNETAWPVTERPLEPEETVQVSLEEPLVDSQTMSEEVGIYGDLVAIVGASSKSFFIVDTRHTDSNRDFFIVDETFSKKDRIGFQGLSKDEPVVIGRGNYSNRFSYPGTVSRNHFEVSYTESGLFITNLRPMNQTVIRAHLASEQPDQLFIGPVVEDLRTGEAEDRVRHHPNFGEKDRSSPYGYYMNYPILGRASSSVDGGVYLGGTAREAIVVDGKSKAMKQVYESVRAKLNRSFQASETLPTEGVLLEVMRTVQNVMPYKAQKTDNISRQHYYDKPVGLSTYLKERAGVCRHQGLLAAYIIENLINDGYLQGAVGVERNTVRDTGGTHAWAVYKTRSSSGEGEKVIVVDPAQSFVGTKKQAQREGRWEYRLSTDEY